MLRTLMSIITKRELRQEAIYNFKRAWYKCVYYYELRALSRMISADMTAEQKEYAINAIDNIKCIYMEPDCIRMKDVLDYLTEE